MAPHGRTEQPRHNDIDLVTAIRRLLRAQGRSYVVIDARDTPFYVQFASAAEGGITGEAVGPPHVTGSARLDREQQERLLGMGWDGPSDESAGNFTRSWPSHADPEAVAEFVRRTLTEGYGVRPGTELSIEFGDWDDGGEDADDSDDEWVIREWVISDREFESVLRLPDRERYGYFVRHVADRERLWVLRSPEGIVRFGDAEGREMVAVWPHERYAAAYAAEEERPEGIALEQWLSDWTPRLASEQILVAVFPVKGDEGETSVVVTADELRGHLIYEAQKWGLDWAP